MIPPDQPTPTRRAWIWPWRPAAPVAAAAWKLAGVADPMFARWWRWVLVAGLIGGGPVLLGYAVGTAAHQIVTALLTGTAILACIRRDDLPRAIGFVGVVFAVHSAAVIALTAHDPERTAAILPGADDYWRRIWLWVSTGADDEYRWTGWAPAHLLLLGSVPLFAYTSFGVLPYLYGFEQVDLMNYYVGRLIRVSDSPVRAVLFGWHPWSVLRGLAFTVLVFEVASWSLERLTGRTLSTQRRRGVRWALGIGFACADAVTKHFLSPIVQAELNANLSGNG